MADNYETNPASGGLQFASDDIGGVHYPIAKLAFGSLDTATLIDSANPLPVNLQSPDPVNVQIAGPDPINTAALIAYDDAGNVTVSPSNPLPITAPSSLDVAVGNWPTLQPVRAETDVGQLHFGGAAATPKYQNIYATGSGNNTILPATTGITKHILSMLLVPTAAVNVYLYSSTIDKLGTDTDRVPLDPTGHAGPAGFVLPGGPYPWFATEPGYGLILNLDSAAPVLGRLVYVEE